MVEDKLRRTPPCPLRYVLAIMLCVLAGSAFESVAEEFDGYAELPVLVERILPDDYLVQTPSLKASAFRSTDGRDLILDNGLIRRVWRIEPNGACVAFDNLMTGQSMLRSVRPEARVTIDGVAYDVGGLVGQPNHAFLTPEWLDAMSTDPNAFQLIDFEIGLPEERFAWGRGRRAAPGSVWPPQGVSLRMDYALPKQGEDLVMGSEVGRDVLWEEDFASLPADWKVVSSKAHARTSFENEGKAGEIYGLQNGYCFAERALPESTEVVGCLIDPGTDVGTSWGPGMAWVFENSIVKLNLRPGDRGEHGQFELRIDGRERLASVPSFAGKDGGLNTEHAYQLRMQIDGLKLICEGAVASERAPKFVRLFEVELENSPGKPRALRVGKMDRSGNATDNSGDAEPLTRCRIQSVRVLGAADQDEVARWKIERRGKLNDQQQEQPVRISVHYELYDGIPVMSKWLTVHNQSEKILTVDRFTGEELALVEQSNWVETREGAAIPHPDYLHVETDFAFGGFNHENANRHAVHWRTDPLYTTQVNYLRQTPCLLVCEPTYGPAQRVPAGKSFEGFRVFELVYDDANRERRGLALRRMYRTIAPWVTENPLTHHLLANDSARVHAAIDQAAEVGFEGIILSFGSGFNMENRDPKFLAQWKAVAQYAAAKKIELGCYSLFSSRGVASPNMIVSPEGMRPTHGQCPAVTSPWGLEWIQTIQDFYAVTGFSQFENDGSYPGDIDVTPRPPLQIGIQDSRWTQWRLMSGLYRNLRGEGVYMNVPDYYYLSGANKCGMGYREVNWSLPRAHQVIHSRQNIYDGTWTKTPSMGWMFVPLSQYHGGGAAATIEPLHQHLDHYQRMMYSNFGMGVQAHYRGPRLYDTEATRDMVKGAVEWFKRYRDILESDLIHGRRADGRDLDWVLHVNPQLPQKGMLVVFNPLKKPVTKMLKVNLYYTGLTDTAMVTSNEEKTVEYNLNRNYMVEIPVNVPAEGMSWFVIE
ncbi:hypothetical protein FF011L_32460 [Roseimaritima multifibrata]|uniref:Alpha-galactosidase n=1 Tax=Roseimaritima multifibrata TaxID=1930274 RepID=A0A517MI50_9BACT|nr:hypothetical protein [Roseimaritima multifibrata]QDS94467.1 hypothetical protein FF011L_32460 [Roseimaritima multifibrata]